MFIKIRILLSSLVRNNFISKINELRYVKHVSLIDNNEKFDLIMHNSFNRFQPKSHYVLKIESLVQIILVKNQYEY